MPEATQCVSGRFRVGKPQTCVLAGTLWEEVSLAAGLEAARGGWVGDTAPESQLQPGEASGPCRAVCGSHSHLCQVARVVKQAGACLPSSFPSPKVYCVSCLRPLQAIYYFILVISGQK